MSDNNTPAEDISEKLEEIKALLERTERAHRKILNKLDEIEGKPYTPEKDEMAMASRSISILYPTLEFPEE